jgi:teichuronic acid biosynthesis glycosyltransferase TuaC
LKVLFVCSGNSQFGINPIIQNQAESLKEIGLDVDFFTVRQSGFRGYLKSVKPLREKIRSGNYSIVHAHYVLSGWIAVLSQLKTPLVLSFMGSDIHGDFNKKGKKTFNGFIHQFLSKLIQPFPDHLIVKSDQMFQNIFYQKKTSVIPNGVCFSHFKEMDKTACRKELKLPTDKKLILFAGNPDMYIKNHQLANEAVKQLDTNISLINPYPVKHKDMVRYYNAADVLLLTSFREGSPNVIKEAMACNLPVVSTKVGDVEYIIKNTSGCFLVDQTIDSVKDGINKALEFNSRTNGRNHIKHLNQKEIAAQIQALYHSLIL